MKLTIFSEVPSLNRLLRIHWATRRTLQRTVSWELRSAYAKPFPTRCRKVRMILLIWSYRGRLLDHDNLYGGAKLLVDAIKKANLIYDDSPRWCLLQIFQEIDRLNPRTEIEIFELGGTS